MQTTLSKIRDRSKMYVPEPGGGGCGRETGGIGARKSALVRGAVHSMTENREQCCNNRSCLTLGSHVSTSYSKLCRQGSLLRGLQKPDKVLGIESGLAK